MRATRSSGGGLRAASAADRTARRSSGSPRPCPASPSSTSSRSSPQAAPSMPPGGLGAREHLDHLEGRRRPQFPGPRQLRLVPLQEPVGEGQLLGGGPPQEELLRAVVLEARLAPLPPGLLAPDLGEHAPQVHPGGLEAPRALQDLPAQRALRAARRCAHPAWTRLRFPRSKASSLPAGARWRRRRGRANVARRGEATVRDADRLRRRRVPGLPAPAGASHGRGGPPPGARPPRARAPPRGRRPHRRRGPRPGAGGELRGPRRPGPGGAARRREPGDAAGARLPRRPGGPRRRSTPGPAPRRGPTSTWSGSPPPEGLEGRAWALPDERAFPGVPCRDAGPRVDGGRHRRRGGRARLRRLRAAGRAARHGADAAPRRGRARPPGRRSGPSPSRGAASSGPRCATWSARPSPSGWDSPRSPGLRTSSGTRERYRGVRAPAWGLTLDRRELPPGRLTPIRVRWRRRSRPSLSPYFMSRSETASRR